MGLTVEEDAKLPTVEAAGADLVDMLHHPNPVSLNNYTDRLYLPWRPSCNPQ